MNGRHNKKILIWIFLVFIVLVLVGNLIFVPKWVTLNNPQTLQISEFSKLPENSLDVLFLGSCQAYQGINPCIIWDSYNITSYVLASPDQRMYTSYYYLKYALETQKPKVVMIDSLFLVESNEEDEHYDAMALYSLPLSGTKIEFSDFLFTRSYQGNRESFQFISDRAGNLLKTVCPFFKFNNRFDIGPTDFRYYLPSYENRVSFFGGVPMFEIMDMSSWSDFMSKKQACETVDEDAGRYFGEIVKLCEENDIELIAFKTLAPYYWNNACYNNVAEYMKDCQIPYIDFNIDYGSYGLDLSEHMYQMWKLNDEGMRITSNYLAEYIVSNTGLTNSAHGGKTAEYYNLITEKYHDVCAGAEWIIH